MTVYSPGRSDSQRSAIEPFTPEMSEQLEAKPPAKLGAALTPDEKKARIQALEADLDWRATRQAAEERKQTRKNWQLQRTIHAADMIRLAADQHPLGIGDTPAGRVMADELAHAIIVRDGKRGDPGEARRILCEIAPAISGDRREAMVGWVSDPDRKTTKAKRLGKKLKFKHADRSD